jgi:hypothetical protein
MPTGKPLGYWKDKKHQKEFFDQLAFKWGIQKVEDWNKVTLGMMLKEGGSFITHYYNNSPLRGTDVSYASNSESALQSIYPSQEWKSYKRHLPVPRSSKGQAFLFDMLQTLFPGSKISSNTILSTENIILPNEDKLRVYEFDVSFVTSSSVC